MNDVPVGRGRPQGWMSTEGDQVMIQEKDNRGKDFSRNQTSQHWTPELVENKCLPVKNPFCGILLWQA